jgi:regulator of sigma E protease
MIDFVQTALAYIVPAFLVLTLVVTVHEFGHFLAARACGVKVDRFSIGFGRAILSHTDRKGVEWRLGWIPLGGYVRFAGDESSASVPDHEDLKLLRADVEKREGPEALKQYFHFKPVWQRAIVVAAGPAANFVLSTLLFAVLLMWIGETRSIMRVDGIQPNSAAARAGFELQDVVSEVDGKPVKSYEDFKQYVAVRGGAPITFTVERDGREVLLNGSPDKRIVTDQLGVPGEIGVLGVVTNRRAGDVTRTRLNPPQALVGGAERTWDVLSTTVTYLGRMVRGEVGTDQIGGPLRIGHTAGGVAKLCDGGRENRTEWLLGVTVGLLGLSAVLSVGIGFMNCCPCPFWTAGICCSTPTRLLRAGRWRPGFRTWATALDLPYC